MAPEVTPDAIMQLALAGQVGPAWDAQAALVVLVAWEALVDRAKWLPLGVFAMVQGQGTDSNDLFQLAVNKAGTIRGNYYNALADTTQPVYGSVDKKSQRAAWTVGERKDPFYELGFANLTKSESTMLVHFGTDRSQQWTLIRMDQPAEKK